MGKIAKQLHYRKGGVAYNINLYSTTADVGSSYIALRVDSAVVYAQGATVGTTGNSSLRYRKSGTAYAVNHKVEDPTMISSGGSVSNPGAYSDLPTTTSASFLGVGNNVTVAYTASVTTATLADSNVTARFTVTILKHVTLSDVHHFRVKFGADSGCSSNGGTFTGTSANFTYKACPATVYVRVDAEDASNNVLYSSAVYSIAPTYRTLTSPAFAKRIYSYDSAGNGATQRWSGAPTDVSAHTWSLGSATTYRYYKNAVYSPTDGEIYSGLACADTCTCNCNYCTCNCNYCTCNCNYCTCNCNYDPCGCASN